MTIETHYSKYVVTDVDYHGGPIPGTETVCHFAHSNTILGIRIAGKVLLTLDEAVYQVGQWNGTGSDGHRYSLYSPSEVEVEAGMTPKLPGMADHDFTRTPAKVGQVVGQGGRCWCGENHEYAKRGDPVSLPAYAHDGQIELASGYPTTAYDPS